MTPMAISSQTRQDRRIVQEDVQLEKIVVLEKAILQVWMRYTIGWIIVTIYVMRSLQLDSELGGSGCGSFVGQLGKFEKAGR